MTVFCRKFGGGASSPGGGGVKATFLVGRRPRHYTDRSLQSTLSKSLRLRGCRMQGGQTKCARLGLLRVLDMNVVVLVVENASEATAKEIQLAPILLKASCLLGRAPSGALPSEGIPRPGRPCRAGSETTFLSRCASCNYGPSACLFRLSICIVLVVQTSSSYACCKTSQASYVSEA